MLLRTSREIPSLGEVVRVLRGQAIDFAGPFRTSKGRIVFRVENKIVVDRELMVLFSAGELNPAGISTLLNRLH